MAFFGDTLREGAAHKPATHLTFRVGGQTYAVPVDILREVTRPGDIARFCSYDPAVVGETSLRGDALIVVDMGLRLTGEPVRANDACMLVVSRETARAACLVSAPGDMVTLAGCLVDEAVAVRAVDEENVRAPENASVSGARHGFPLYPLDGETVLLPPVEAFFPQ